MARPGISYQEVAAAADSIVAAGENPTIQRVRDALGTGSPNTIHKHLTAWRNAAPVLERKAPELPADLQAAIVRELERQAAESRSELEKQLVQAQAEAAELASAGEQLETDMDALSERNQALSDECQRLGALANERHDEIESLKAELERERKGAEEARILVAQERNKNEILDARIIEQHGELVEANMELKKALAAAVAAEKEVAVAEAKLEAERATAADLRQRLADMQTQAKADAERHEQALKAIQVQARSDADEHTKALNAANGELMTALKQGSALERELSESREANQQLQAKVEELEKALKNRATRAQKKEG